MVERLLTGDGLDAPDPGGDAALADDAEQPNVTRAANVRATAQFGGKLAQRQHAHDVLVLLAEQRHRARPHRLVVLHLAGLGGSVAANLGIDQPLDPLELLRRDRLEVREVEAQPVRCNQRALLHDMAAEHLAQRGVQQVSGGMVQPDGLAGRGVNACGDALAQLELTLLEHAHVPVGLAQLAGVRHPEPRVFAAEQAGVADLAAALGVKRRCIEHHLAGLARLERRDLRTIADQRQHGADTLERVVAAEVTARIELDGAAQVDTEAACRPGALALRLHGGLEPGLIHGQAALARDVRGKVHREAIGVVQFEGNLTRDLLAGQRRDL